MKILVMVALVIALALPASLFAQEENEIRQMLTDFQQALRVDDYPKAVSYLSRDFIRQLTAPAPEGQSAPGAGEEFLHQNAIDFVKKEMDGVYEDCQIVSITQTGDRAVAELKPAEGKLVKFELVKDPSAGWKIALAPRDVLKESQKQDEAQIQALREKQRQREQEERRDQRIADDVVDDLK